MDFKELLQLSFDALRSNLVRTLLTMLGIIIGIASVITIISLGEGSTASIVNEFSTLGANIVTVSPGRFTRGPGGGGGISSTLVESDADAIEGLTNVVLTSSTISGTKALSANGETTNSNVQGVETSYQEIQSLTLSAGRFFDESEVQTASRDVVLGDTVVEDLFGENSEEFAIGESVRIDNKSFLVIGVITESSSVIIPLTTAQKILFAQSYLNSISVEVMDTELIDSTITQIENTLLIQHDIDKLEDADFSVTSIQAITDSISSVTGTLTAMISGIAAISLIVGGIGIMNIMLVTVTERTKEIGLLKAIGAKRRDILTQFLVESAVLTMFGGMIGMLLGISLSFIISSLINIPFVISVTSIILAISVSAAVGILFGWYPAKKAADLSPIDALRYE